MLVITKAERGGAQSHLLELLAFRDRARLTVVSGEDGFLLREARSLGLDTVVLPDLVAPLAPRRDLAALLALVRLLRRLKPDLVHLHSSKAGLLGRLAAWVSGVPAVFTAHGWAFTEGASSGRRRLAALSERLAAPLSRAIIAVSDYDRALAARLGVTRRAVTIHNGLPIHNGLLHPSPDRDPSTVRLLMVARFAPPKDQALLLRAAAPFAQAEVWLIGDGPELLAAQTLAAELGTAERVRFLGNRSDVPELLSGGDVFCLVSHYEGFPISILEAMRAGLPVIASQVGGVAEAVEHGQTGLLVAHNDLAHWRVALAALIDDAPLRAQMGRAGRARFEQHFTTGPMLERVWTTYQAVWTGTRPSPPALTGKSALSAPARRGPQTSE
jgi:glycosyltransferase involved in cell wall biosynthesis